MADIDMGRYRVQPRRPAGLDRIDPDEGRKQDGPRRAAIEATFAADLSRLRELQDRLFAERRRALLVVLLAIDTGGKDSTINRVFSGVNPQGCFVRSFDVPSEEERRHDFLWRVHPHVPPAGMIGIFNRSHYEDVTVPRVRGAIDDQEVTRRYEHIRAFERLLRDSGTSVLKFHLRISKDEQARRLLERIDDPAKHWKFNPGDLDDRARWGDYQAAFEEAIHATTTDDAPWHVVPANAKWYRDAVIARAVVEALEALDPRFPAPVDDIEQYRARIEA